jgi:hypothetical protein
LDYNSLAHPKQLEKLLTQANEELEALEPKLEALDLALRETQQEYDALKQSRQRLLTIKASLKSLLRPEPSATDISQEAFVQAACGTSPNRVTTPKGDVASMGMGEGFSAEIALHAAQQHLRQRDSVNFEIYRALVYAGGYGSTDTVKTYLIEQNIRQPATGDDFANVSLADISARINYLVKKKLVTIERRGHFRLVHGWG